MLSSHYIPLLDPVARPSLCFLVMYPCAPLWTPVHACAPHGRLRHICEAEGFEADVRGLNALAAQTDGDIRACLNTLQFLHRANRALRASEVAEQVVGRKDATKGLMDVWNEVRWSAVRWSAVRWSAVRWSEVGRMQWTE
ncbi:unnamed protein product [Closterium sp. Yama58-4]|nr:unnamed protein product [Closterium sp. Yama58-4]